MLTPTVRPMQVDDSLLEFSLRSETVQVFDFPFASQITVRGAGEDARRVRPQSMIVPVAH